MLKLYQWATTLAMPLIKLHLLRRRKKGKEDALRFNERFGVAAFPRPSGKLAWFHAASAGESISIIPLIKRLSEKYPGLNFLVTTGTVNSARIMAGMLPNNAIHQFVPVDITCCVRKFLAHWKPDIAVFVESEIWPNLIVEASKTCPLIMVNGHMSYKSFQSWVKLQKFSQQVFGAFTLCLAQCKADEEYLKRLGAKNTKYAGNIKYDAPPLPADPHALAEFTSMVGIRKIWLAASTHNENGLEEAIIAATHIELKLKYPDILTIIVPRHSIRKDEILAELKNMQLNVAVRSNGDKVASNADIYLADTMGELGIFYRVADIVFVGGSLVERGGHNPLEPARLGCAIIVGPHTFNFTEINNEFIEHKALVVVENQADLTRQVENLLTSQEETSRLKNSALKLVNTKTGILDNITREISPYLKIED